MFRPCLSTTGHVCFRKEHRQSLIPTLGSYHGCVGHVEEQGWKKCALLQEHAKHARLRCLQHVWAEVDTEVLERPGDKKGDKNFCSKLERDTRNSAGFCAVVLKPRQRRQGRPPAVDLDNAKGARKRAGFNAVVVDSREEGRLDFLQWTWNNLYDARKGQSVCSGIGTKPWKEFSAVASF